jgi:hypothetical protein
MKKSELKKILKPLIKECIREVILEESGVLSKIVAEVANGLTTAAPTAQVVVEDRSTNAEVEHQQYLQKLQETRNQKQQMLESIGNSAYEGMDIFEGTSPALPESDGRSPLSGRDPKDAGIDISNIAGANPAMWKALAGNTKKGR